MQMDNSEILPRIQMATNDVTHAESLPDIAVPDIPMSDSSFSEMTAQIANKVTVRHQNKN
jgi:hypothetical protein